jgi:hypothetical protein
MKKEGEKYVWGRWDANYGDGKIWIKTLEKRLTKGAY